MLGKRSKILEERRKHVDERNVEETRGTGDEKLQDVDNFEDGTRF